MGKESIEDIEIPEKGAPMWVVTFGDLMSLLLCFFVLLLSFSEIDAQKYKEMAGSMAKAFGVQRSKKSFQKPMGQKIIAQEFEKAHIAKREKEEFGKEVKKAIIEAKLGDLKNLIEVEIKDDKVVISMMGETTFDSGKADVRPQMLPLLKKIAAALKTTKGPIIISGHTDNVPINSGPFGSNLALSAARATKVAQTLLSYGHIDPRRLSVAGFGEYQPIESNDSLQGREKNRRVEIILKEKDLPKR
jgi:chemotaxis protein MotB